MSKFQVRDTVIVNRDGEFYEGIIWNQNDFREPSMEYVVMLEDKNVGDEDGMVFVGEDKMMTKGEYLLQEIKEQSEAMTLKAVINQLRELPPDSPIFETPEEHSAKTYKRIAPETVEAIQFRGGQDEDEVSKFLGNDANLLVHILLSGDTYYYIEPSYNLSCERIPLFSSNYIYKTDGEVYVASEKHFELHYKEVNSYYE